MATITSKMILICLLLSLGKFTNSVKFGYVDVVDLIKFGHEVMTNVLESWELVNPRDPEFENSLPFIHRMERELKTHISRVSHKIDRFQEQMDVRLDTIVAKLLTEIPLQERLDQKLRMIDQSVGQINDLYNIFELYSMAPDKYAKFTLEDFARTCVSSRSGALPDLLKRIHRLFVPSPDEILSRSVIILLANQMAGYLHAGEYYSDQVTSDNWTYSRYKLDKDVVGTL